jgi:hypothetical protein
MQETRSAWRDEDRFTYDERRTMTGVIIVEAKLGEANLGDERGRLARLAARSIGCTLDDFRCSELHWLAGTITLVMGLADTNEAAR